MQPMLFLLLCLLTLVSKPSYGNTAIGGSNDQCSTGTLDNCRVSITFLLTFSRVAVQQAGHSGASSSRHGKVFSVEELERQYSCLLETATEREAAEASKSRLIQALGVINQVQTDGTGGPWGMPLYAAYMDDVLLQKDFSRPESELLANPMADTFVRAMSNDAMWLALFFCSYA
jgi:hypothetical protein